MENRNTAKVVDGSDLSVESEPSSVASGDSSSGTGLSVDLADQDWILEEVQKSELRGNLASAVSDKVNRYFGTFLNETQERIYSEDAVLRNRWSLRLTGAFSGLGSFIYIFTTKIYGGWEHPLFTPLIFAYSAVGVLAGLFCFVSTAFFLDWSAKNLPLTVTRCAWISVISFTLNTDLMGTLVGSIPEHKWFWVRRNCNATCMGIANARCGANMSSVAISGAFSCSAELMISQSPAAVVYGMFVQRLLYINLFQFVLPMTNLSCFLGNLIGCIHFVCTLGTLPGQSANIQYILGTAFSFFLLKYFDNATKRSRFCTEQIMANQNIKIKTVADEAEKEAVMVKKENVKVKAKANDLQQQVALTNLSDGQQEMVRAYEKTLLDEVPARFCLDWKDLKFKRRIGSGSFGDCFLGFFRKSRKVAIKKMRAGLIDDKGVKNFKNEVIMLATVNHPHLVEFVGYVSKPALLIVMGYVNGGTLLGYVAEKRKRSIKQFGTEESSWEMLDVRDTLRILMQVADGICHLHAMRPRMIIHRDIKSENILITKDRVPKIADLGEARKIDQQKTMTQIGTNGYAAPEILRGKRYTEKVDVYSFAVMAYELVFARERFHELRFGNDGREQDSWSAINAQIANNNLRPQIPFVVSGELIAIISQCWDENPKLRLSCEELNHRFAVMLSFAKSSSTNKDLLSGHAYRKSCEGNKESFEQESARSSSGGDIVISTKFSRQQSLSAFSAGAIATTGIMRRDDALSLCMSFTSALWGEVHAREHDQAKIILPVQSVTVKNMVHANARFNAKDPVFDQILSGAEGPGGLVVLGSLMFPEDSSAMYEPEPLLPEDIFVHQDSISLRVRFYMTHSTSTHTFTAGSLKSSRVTEVFGRQHDGLEKLKRGLGEILHRKISHPSTKRNSRSRLRSMRNRAGRRQSATKNDDAIKKTFLAAAAYARGEAVDIFPPVMKVRIFGLIQQACFGNCPYSGRESISRSSSRRDVLDVMKRAAWSGQKDRSAIDCMKELIEIVDNTSPGWNSIFAKAMRGRPKTQTRSNKGESRKLMVWFIQLSLVKRDMSPLKALAVEDDRNPHDSDKDTHEIRSMSIQLTEGQAQIQGIYICEGDNSAQSGPSWYEYKKRREGEELHRVKSFGFSALKETKEGDIKCKSTGFLYPSYLEDLMPWKEELSIIQPECKTLREQDLFFFNRMLDLTDVDKHSDFVAIHGEDTAGLRVYVRQDTSFSSGEVHLSEAIVDAEPGLIRKLALSNWENTRKNESREAANAVDNIYTLWKNEDEYDGFNVLRRVQYRRLALPWPIRPRESLYINLDMQKTMEDGTQVVVNCSQSLKAQGTEGALPMVLQYQGFVGKSVTKRNSSGGTLPETASEKQECTRLFFHHSLYIEPGLIPGEYVSGSTDALLEFPLAMRAIVKKNKEALEKYG